MRILFVSLALMLFSFQVVAEESATANDEELVNCSFYKAKRTGVPVYEKRDKSARVLATLELGQKVCYIGEQSGFAILDWRKQHLVDEVTSTKDITVEPGVEAAYVALHDLWPPEEDLAQEQKDKTLFTKGKEQLERMRSGVVPEDIYGPLRPFIDFVHSPTKCRAGDEICSKIAQEQEELEDK